MSDEKNNPIDDDEILELDDFQDDLGVDDFDDDEWDDLDDDSGLETTGNPATPQNKTFVQKYFNLIVIAVVLVAIGFVALGQMMKSDRRSPDPARAIMPIETAQQDPAPIDNTTPLPPLPEPLNNTIEEVDVTTSEGNNALQILQDGLPEIEGTLTPLPDIQASTETELPSLDELNILNIENETHENIAPEEALEIIAEQIEEANNEPEILTLETFKPIAVPTLSPEPDIIDFETEKLATEKMVPTAEAPTVDTSAFEAQISVLQNELETTQTDLGQELQERDQTIASLRGVIESMKEEVSALKAQAQATPTGPTFSMPSPKTAKPAPVATPKLRHAPVKSRIKWVMRSAQPGKALVSKEGASGVYAVEVGSALSGIGTVTSIAPENGKWIVRGTKGTITQ